MSPDKITLDLVVCFGEKLQPNGCILSAPRVLVVLAANHQSQLVQVMLPFNLDGLILDGPPPRFVLYKLGPGVWKLAPSVTVPGMLHAFITIVGVPDPAPWETIIRPVPTRTPHDQLAREAAEWDTQPALVSKGFVDAPEALPLTPLPKAVLLAVVRAAEEYAAALRASRRPGAPIQPLIAAEENLDATLEDLSVARTGRLPPLPEGYR